MEQVEREHILRVLAATPTLEEAARVLGIDASTLWRKRKRYEGDGTERRLIGKLDPERRATPGSALTPTRPPWASTTSLDDGEPEARSSGS